MSEWQSRGDIHGIHEWPKVDELRGLALELASELDKERDKEWLAYLVSEVGTLIPRSLEEGWQQPYVSEFILGLYDALSYLTCLEYYLDFMGNQGFVDAARARNIGAKAKELQDDISALLARTRDELRVTRPDMEMRGYRGSQN